MTGTRPPASATATAAAGAAPARRLSPTARRTRGPLAMLAAQVKAEFLSNVRAPDFVIGVVAIPVFLFLMFGPPNARFTLPEGTRVSTLMMPGFGAYGLLSLVIFAFGVEIAQERAKGWLRLMRATPVSAWAYFTGKLAMSLLFAVATLIALFAVAAAFAQVRMPLGQWLAAAGALLGGALALAPMGFALGFWARARAATTIGNLIFLPLSFASGFFFPLAQLPQFLRDLAPFLPTYHYGQLVWATVGTPADVEAYVGTAPEATWVHVAWLVGTFVVFGVLAGWGYRRDRRREA
jgi:ABC-2 type transport system permease protein